MSTQLDLSALRVAIVSLDDESNFRDLLRWPQRWAATNTAAISGFIASIPSFMG